MIRIVRQGRVRATQERWLLHGVVRIVTHPLPHWQECPPWFVEEVAHFRTVPTGADPPAVARTQPGVPDEASEPAARGKSARRAVSRRRLTGEAGQS